MNRIQPRSIACVGLAGMLCAAAIVLGATGSDFTTDSRLHSGLDPHAWTTIDQDDFDAGLFDARTDAESICRLGVRSQHYTEPAAACRASYEQALAQHKFERAMQYAAIGCRMYSDSGACRLVGGLPLLVGNQGIRVPAALAEELKRMAEFVCVSGAHLMSVVETDITGRECSYLARQFELARDPEYTWALEPATREFFEAIDEPARAAHLYQAACGRLGYALGCESLRALSQRVSRHELEEVTEILERETGIALAGKSQGRQVDLSELDEVTEILEREVGDGLRSACAAANCDARVPTAASSGASVLTGR